MHIAYLAHKKFNIPDTVNELTHGVPGKQYTSLLAYFNFTFGDYQLDVSFDDKEFQDFNNDFHKY